MAAAPVVDDHDGGVDGDEGGIGDEAAADDGAMNQVLNEKLAAELAKRESKQAEYSGQVRVALELAIETAVAITRELRDDKKQSDVMTREVSQLRSLIASLIKHEFTFTKKKDAFHKTQELLKAQKLAGATTNFEQFLTKLVGSAGESKEIKHAMAKSLKEATHIFDSKVWAVTHPGEPFPTPDHDDDDDEALLVVQLAVAQRQCPITKDELEDPVKSTVCGHIYSRAAIEEMIKMNGRSKTGCPVFGCTHNVTRKQLETDVVTARALKRKDVPVATAKSKPKQKNTSTTSSSSNKRVKKEPVADGDEVAADAPTSTAVDKDGNGREDEDGVVHVDEDEADDDVADLTKRR